MSRKTYFFFGGVRPSDGEKHITVGEDFRVDGGSRDEHERMVDLTQEVAKEVKKDPPQTQGEWRMIVRDAAKKAGMAK